MLIWGQEVFGDRGSLGIEGLWQRVFGRGSLNDGVAVGRTLAEQP